MSKTPSFAELLKRYRRDRSQDEIVHLLSKQTLTDRKTRIEIKKAMISHYETGRYLPGVEYADAFANVLSLPIEDVLSAIAEDTIRRNPSAKNVCVRWIDPDFGTRVGTSQASVFLDFGHSPPSGLVPGTKGLQIFRPSPAIGDLLIHWLEVPRKATDPILDFIENRETYTKRRFQKEENLTAHTEGGEIKFYWKKGVVWKLIDGKPWRKMGKQIFDLNGERKLNLGEEAALKAMGKLKVVDEYSRYKSYGKRLRTWAADGEKVTRIRVPQALNKIADLMEPDSCERVAGHTRRFRDLFYQFLHIEMTDANSDARFIKEVALNEVLFPELRSIVQREVDKSTFRRLCFTDDKISFATLRKLLKVTSQYVDTVSDRYCVVRHDLKP